MQSAERSSSGSVYHTRAPFFIAQQQQSAFHSSPETLTHSPTGSSVTRLQIPPETEHSAHSLINPFLQPAERAPNARTLFVADDLTLRSVRQPNMRHQNRHVHLDVGSNQSHTFFNPIDSSFQPAPTTSSIQPGTGVGRIRAAKRKSRVTSKVPMKVFTADAANFMAIVHKLTGFQSAMCLSVETPQKPLLQPLPFQPSHPVMQGMCNAETSEFSNTLYCSNPSSLQRTQFSSFGIGSGASDERASIQGAQAIVPRLWQPTREFCQKGTHSMDLYGSETKLWQEVVHSAGYQEHYPD